MGRMALLLFRSRLLAKYLGHGACDINKYGGVLSPVMRGSLCASLCSVQVFCFCVLRVEIQKILEFLSLFAVLCSFFKLFLFLFAPPVVVPRFLINPNPGCRVGVNPCLAASHRLMSPSPGSVTGPPTPAAPAPVAQFPV